MKMARLLKCLSQNETQLKGDHVRRILFSCIRKWTFRTTKLRFLSRCSPHMKKRNRFSICIFRNIFCCNTDISTSEYQNNCIPESGLEASFITALINIRSRWPPCKTKKERKKLSKSWWVFRWISVACAANLVSILHTSAKCTTMPPVCPPDISKWDTF